MVVEVDADVCFEQDRWRHATIYRRIRPDLHIDDLGDDAGVVLPAPGVTVVMTRHLAHAVRSIPVLDAAEVTAVFTRWRAGRRRRRRPTLSPAHCRGPSGKGPRVAMHGDGQQGQHGEGQRGPS